jgi:hypothetical protein
MYYIYTFTVIYIHRNTYTNVCVHAYTSNYAKKTPQPSLVDPTRPLDTASVYQTGFY